MIKFSEFSLFFVFDYYFLVVERGESICHLVGFVYHL